jgi:plasmid maintenance system antidote protein VapI
MEIHDRLRKIIEDENISISKFERTIGVGQNSVSTCLRRNSTISHEVLQGVAKHFPSYSMEWLVAGRDSGNKEIIQRVKKILREMEDEVDKIS